MQILTHDLSSFQRDSSFYGSIELLATIKNFDLQAIRARYLASKQNPNARTGSVERRAPAQGGVLSFTLDKGNISAQAIHCEMKEPRGIAHYGDTLAVSSENRIYLLTGSSVKTIDDPWFSYIHTVDFSADGKHLLVSSSGFDLIVDYDLQTLERSADWCAWEHGFDQGLDPETGQALKLSRIPSEAGPGVKIISDPERDSLPTAMRAAFINSVEYDRSSPKHYIATFFHEGSVYRIDSESGIATRLISDLKNPHGGHRSDQVSFATSTRGGEVVIQKNEQENRYAFHELPLKPDELGSEEWLQNSKLLPDGSIITIDSNRTAWVIFHPEKELIDYIPYPNNLAIQDFVLTTGEQNWNDLLKQL